MEKNMFLALLGLVFCAIYVHSNPIEIKRKKIGNCKLFKSTANFCNLSKRVKTFDGLKAPKNDVSI